MGDLICAGWQHSIKQAVLGYMKCIDENFLAVVTGDPTVANTPLDWMLANKEGLGM